MSPTLFALVYDGFPTAITLITVITDVSVEPIRKRLLKDAKNNFCIHPVVNATDLQAEKIVEEIDGTEMLKPVIIMCRKPFERERPMLKKLWVEREEAHGNG
jgi:hypothetical protein